MSARKRRRAERLRQQIAVLETMDANAWRNALYCSLALITGFAAIIQTGLWFHAGTLTPLSVLLSTAGGVLTLFIIRNWAMVLWTALMVLAALALLLLIEDIPDMFSGGDAPGGEVSHDSQANPADFADAANNLDISSPEKSKHRRRIERAIAKRKARLELLL